MRIGIVGAGVAGRLLAWRLSLAGHSITIFDKETRDSKAACSFDAAGILSPYAELEMAEATIFELGERSLELYPQWLKQLSSDVFFLQQGSIVSAHPSDKIELEHFSGLLKRKVTLQKDSIETINIEDKEKELAHLGQGFFLPEEGQIDPVELLDSLNHELKDTEWRQQKVISIKPCKITTKNKDYKFDWTFDCRGMGAKKDLQLRAVRGELIWLDAPEVNIKHLTRLMHPRYRIYIVPRPNNVYLIGATEIESDDYSDISVRSTLELLSAAYSVHKGFGEARIIKSVVNCRPAMPDNLPVINVEQGYGEINGLYRHGILLAPALVEKAIKRFVQLSQNKSLAKEKETEKEYAING